MFGFLKMQEYRNIQNTFEYMSSMSIMWHCIKFCSPDLHSFPSPQWITVAARGKSYRPWHILTLQQISGWGQHVPQNEPQTPQRKWNVWNMFESPQQYLTTVRHRADWADHGAKMSKVEEPLDWILWRWRRTKPCFNIFQHLSTETADWLLYSWLCWLLYNVSVLFYFILISVWWISMWEFSAWSRLSRLTESHWGQGPMQTLCQVKSGTFRRSCARALRQGRESYEMCPAVPGQFPKKEMNKYPK